MFHVEHRLAALQFLQVHHVLTIATTDEVGVWCSALFYAASQFELFFLSSPRSRHSQAIVNTPRVAATIQGQPRDWPAIQGIQLEGTVHQLEGDALDRGRHCYFAKFPDIARDPTLQMALSRSAWYQLTPSRLYWIDNQHGFGRQLIVS